MISYHIELLSNIPADRSESPTTQLSPSIAFHLSPRHIRLSLMGSLSTCNKQPSASQKLLWQRHPASTSRPRRRPTSPCTYHQHKCTGAASVMEYTVTQTRHREALTFGISTDLPPLTPSDLTPHPFVLASTHSLKRRLQHTFTEVLLQQTVPEAPSRPHTQRELSPAHSSRSAHPSRSS